ncbi:hypothetical protein D0817_24640 [Flavobacterium cupreum]|uniref:Uncharacterized protein n=2 Tax=Flavobacterium TaxID=237 RepID=A0A4Y7U520_9FLAO|nr:hypothetical protein [Flavobacterium]RUT67754.1 hypothetical protein D0817_24640 [Flavobacterium cupreum]TEB41351.1 hypothetical protein D0809_25965 [Flavobacterium circumlabens]
MKKIILLSVFLYINNSYGQNKDEIFRLAGDFKDAAGYSYNVNVLILHQDKIYSFIEQEYYSKRLAKKNVPSRYLKTKGNWKMRNDTLKLIDSETKREKLFIRKKTFSLFI